MIGGAVLTFLGVVLALVDGGVEAAFRKFWKGWGRKMAAKATVNLYRLMYGLTWLPGGTE